MPFCHNHFALVGLQSIVMSMPVCLSVGRSVDRSVCLSVCLCVLSHSSKPTLPNFTKCLCILFVAVARSSSNGVTIRYILPVLRMTSCFYTVRPVGGRARRCAVYCRWAWPLAGRGLLQPAGSLARRVYLLGGWGRVVRADGRWLSGGWTRLLTVTVVRVLPCA